MTALSILPDVEARDYSRAPNPLEAMNKAYERRKAKVRQVAEGVGNQNTFCTRGLMVRSFKSTIRLQPPKTPQDRLKNIIRCACWVWKVSPKEILGKRQVKGIREARNFVYYHAYNRLRGVSVTAIGQWLNRHHSTVSHGARAHARENGLSVNLRDNYGKKFAAKSRNIDTGDFELHGQSSPVKPNPFVGWNNG